MPVKPKVSICIPTYNQTTYLKVLLESTVKQTYTNFEIIVSDDSTTADVKKLIDTFHFGDTLKYFRNNPSLGSPANWNAAIKKATGEYIKIMHHDDAFTSSTALAEMLSSIQDNGYDYLFSDSSVENVKSRDHNRIHQIRKFDRLVRKPYLLFFGNSIGGPSTLLTRKNKFNDLEYDTRFIWLVDIEYYIRLFKTNGKGSAISKPLILTHDSADHQLTSAILKDFELQIKEQAMLYDLLAAKTPAATKFFMQIYLVRLFYKAKTSNKALGTIFIRTPRLIKMYFSFVKFKPLYFAYYLFIRVFDVLRKLIVI